MLTSPSKLSVCFRTCVLNLSAREAKCVSHCFVALVLRHTLKTVITGFLVVISVVVSSTVVLYSELCSKILQLILFVVEVKLCEKEKLSPVCGMDGQTYNSLCALQKARQLLAYTGICRSNLCNDQVCGADRNTYASICHAHARRIRVDHTGKCFPKM